MAVKGRLGVAGGPRPGVGSRDEFGCFPLTYSRESPKVSETALNTEQLRELLESSGSRCTRQRLAVYDFLRASDPNHPTAEEIYRGVKTRMPRISLATVYKALEALEGCGVVTRLAGPGDSSARFDARGDRHYHLRCVHSGRVEDLPTPFDPELISKLDPELAASLLMRGFRVTGYRFELLGYFEPEADES